jgi:hypothetical protein
MLLCSRSIVGRKWLDGFAINAMAHRISLRASEIVALGVCESARCAAQGGHLLAWPQ